MKEKIIESQPSTSQAVNESTTLLIKPQLNTYQTINNNETQNNSLIEEINNSQNEKSLCDLCDETMIGIISCETIKCTIL